LTAAPVSYDYYLADEYACANCAATPTSGVLVRFPAGTSVTVNKWYKRVDSQPYSYKITSSSSSGIAVNLKAGLYNSCTAACPTISVCEEYEVTNAEGAATATVEWFNCIGVKESIQLAGGGTRLLCANYGTVGSTGLFVTITDLGPCID
jgi:hypothetical protein